ncbi:MAG: SIMPL domain-containing protein [Herminiimonas sp.]|nr:SIMPL domain-containing protein [Herminiimonas sp.]
MASQLRFFLQRLSALPLALLSCAAIAQAPLPTAGTLVVIPAYGEVRQANDEAHLTMSIEEQDKDKTVVASRVNLKMKQGVEILKREDPQAVLRTRGYYTYPVYPDEPQPKGTRVRQPIAWRIGQYVDLTTTNLPALPKTVAAAQKILSLSSINFGLSSAASKRLDDKRITATWQNLSERLASVAGAMGRKVTDAVLDTVDFEGSGAYAQAPEGVTAKASMRSAMAEQVVVEEPSFEPGETTLQMRLVAKVRFK